MIAWEEITSDALIKFLRNILHKNIDMSDNIEKPSYMVCIFVWLFDLLSE